MKKLALKIIVNGASGKMGRYAVDAIESADDLTLVAALGRNDDLAQTIAATQADVVVDLTTPDAVFVNTQIIINAGAHPVIGTTGLSDAQLQQLTTLTKDKQLGGIIAPNFSIGAVLMMQFAKQAAPYFNDIEIIEKHHAQKKDAPSGTAKKTQQLMNKDVAIHSVRLPGVVAEQQVLFGDQGETLTIEHRCIDRVAYMAGMLLCCGKVVDLNELVYGLEHIL